MLLTHTLLVRLVMESIYLQRNYFSLLLKIYIFCKFSHCFYSLLVLWMPVCSFVQWYGFQQLILLLSFCRCRRRRILADELYFLVALCCCVWGFFCCSWIYMPLSSVWHSLQTHNHWCWFCSNSTHPRYLVALVVVGTVSLLSDATEFVIVPLKTSWGILQSP